MGPDSQSFEKKKWDGLDRQVAGQTTSLETRGRCNGDNVNRLTMRWTPHGTQGRRNTGKSGVSFL